MIHKRKSSSDVIENGNLKRQKYTVDDDYLDEIDLNILDENDPNDFIDFEDIEFNKCARCKKNLPIRNFFGKWNQPVKNCIQCRKHYAKYDKTRSGGDPEKTKHRRKYKKKNHYKQSLGWMKFRAKKMEKKGVDIYRKEAAIRMRIYRYEHRDEMLKYYRELNQTKPVKFNYYKNKAFKDGKVWELTETEAFEMMDSNCVYCGREPTKERINGIDRVDSYEDYVKGNCVSSCTMCNYMKGCLDPITFMKRCEHILTYQNIINGELNYGLFPNHKSGNFNMYQKRAKIRDLPFTITQNDFCRIKRNRCYFCGKFENKSHNNGIDRVDNSRGYEKDNIQACCGECNYMKKNFDSFVFIQQLLFIYDYTNEYHDIFTYDINDKNKKYVKKQQYFIIKNQREKLTVEEKIELEKERKRERDINMKNRLLNPEYREKRARELAERRLTERRLAERRSE